MKGLLLYNYIYSRCTLRIWHALAFIFLTSNTYGQTLFYDNINISLKGGVLISVEGDIVQENTGTITTLDSSFIWLDGSIYQTSSTTDMFGTGDRTEVVFNNSGPGVIQGAGAFDNVKFHELTLQGGSTIDLNSDIWIYDNLNLVDGNLEANGYKVFFELDPTGNSMAGRFFGDGDFYPTLTGEEDTKLIINGHLFVNGIVGSTFGNNEYNYGGMGFELKSPGLTEIDIKRSYTTQILSPSKNSIMRWFDVQSTTPVIGGNDIGFSFLNADLPGGINVNDLVFFNHTLDGSDNTNTENNLDGSSSWLNKGLDGSSSLKRELNNVDSVYTKRWTLADCVSPLVTVSSNSADTVCVEDIVTLDAGNEIGWSYLWNTGETTQTIDVTNTSAATETFTVNVTNAELCFKQDSIKVTWENYPVVTITENTSYVCAGDNYTISPTYGSTDLSYSWSSGETTPEIVHTSDGTQTVLYAVTVTNPAGCQRTDSILIIDRPEVLVDLGMDTTNCDGGPVMIDAFDPGNQNTITYLWSNSSTTSAIAVSSTGFYAVTVSDVVTNCTNNDEIFVAISDIQITIDSLSHPDCNGDPTGDIYLTITNPEPMTDYLWSNGDMTEDIDFVPAGSYNITVTDILGCADSIVGIILTDPSAIVSNPIIENDTCGLGIGSIISNISGGSPGYMYNWYQSQLPLPNPNLQDQMGLKAGFYELEVLDSKSCFQYFQFDVFGAMDTLEIMEQGIVHETCLGEADGSIDITVTGGNFGYNYMWSNGATTEDISGLTAGTYTVQVTDSEGCMKEAAFEILAPEIPIVQVDQIQLAGCESANGSISVTIMDGGSNYQSIQWSNGEMTEDIANLVAGDYMYTIMYAVNCTISDIITVGSTEAITSAPVINDDECNDAMGSIFTNVSGGTGTIEYNWSTTDDTPNLLNIPKGDYSVTITDEVGCELINSFTVISPDTLKINPEVVNVTCFGGADGSINVNATGGTPGLTYNWSNGSATPALVDIEIGTYDVTITDANLCSISSSFAISEPTEIQTTEIITHVDCAGDATGSINLSTSGATPTYTYMWSDNSTNEDLLNVTAGNYSVTITDAVLCTKVYSYTISEPGLLVINPVVVNDDCNMMEGSIQTNPSGGTLPWDLAWSNGASTQDIANLAGGNYMLTLEDDNGCLIIESFEVTSPELLTLSGQVQNVQCNDFSNGEIDLTILGGNPGYDITWSNGATHEDLSNLAPGIYSVTVTDGTDCEVTETFIISQPDELSIFEILGHPTTIGASDGTISVALLGGTEPYNYEWSSGQFSASIINLSSGIYTVTVTDDNGCSLIETYELNDPSMLFVEGIEKNTSCADSEDGEIDISVFNGSGNYSYSWSNGIVIEDLKDLEAGSYSVTVTDNVTLETVSMTFIITSPDPVITSNLVVHPTCFGEGSGSIDLSISGGVDPYTFLWSNGQTSEDLNFIPAGMYSVTVTDMNDCEDISEFELIQPDEIESFGMITSTSSSMAFDGTIDLEVEGGTAPYSYSWSSGQISQDVMNLGIGQYIVEITDDNDCIVTDTFDVSETEMINIDLIAHDVTCFGGADGAIESTIVGGQEPYSYQWSNGGESENIEMLTASEYSLTVTDNNGLTGETIITIEEPEELTDNKIFTFITCFGEADGSIIVNPDGGSSGYSYLWSDGSMYNMIGGLDTGDYFLTIADLNGCESTFEYSMIQPDELGVFGAITNPTEAGNDGGIDVFTNGGTEPYNYLWNDGTMEEDRSDLDVGIYDLTVTDDNGCTTFGSYELEVEEFNVQVNITNVSCFGLSDGSIDLEIIGGGVSPYSYAWDNGESTEDIMGLMAGMYEVTITDNIGTTGIYVYTVEKPDSISLTAIVIDPACHGSNNGSIDLTIFGGNDISSISWSNGESTEDLNLLFAGIYEVTVVDVNDCMVSETFTLIEPEVLVATYEISNVACDGSPIGTITMTATGGSTPYDYEWSNGAFSNELTNLDVGFYGVTLTDDNGCFFTDQIEIEQDIAFTVSSEIEDVTCFNASDASISLTVSNAVDPVSYQWFDGSTASTINGLDVGNYFVTITDGTGCELITSYSIEEPATMTLNLVTINTGCTDSGEGQIFTSVEGGTSPYSYAWSDGSTTEDIDNAIMGDYIVTVTDAGGCSVAVTANIFDSPEEFLIRFLARSLVNAEETINFIDVSFPKPSTWSWDFGDGIGTSTEEDPEYTFGTDITKPISIYPVTLEATTPFCLGMVTKEIEIINGKFSESNEEIEEIRYTKIESLNVYPNPTNGFVNVDVILNQKDITYIDIFDMEGRRMNTFKVEGNSIYSKNLRVDHLSTGMYVVVVRSGKDRKASKLVVID